MDAVANSCLYRSLHLSGPLIVNQNSTTTANWWCNRTGTSINDVQVIVCIHTRSTPPVKLFRGVQQHLTPITIYEWTELWDHIPLQTFIFTVSTSTQPQQLSKFDSAEHRWQCRGSWTWESYQEIEKKGQRDERNDAIQWGNSEAMVSIRFIQLDNNEVHFWSKSKLSSLKNVVFTDCLNFCRGSKYCITYL